MAEEKKDRRGGPRPGAGRKYAYGEPQQPITLKLPVSLLRKLDAKADKLDTYRSHLIISAIRQIV